MEVYGTKPKRFTKEWWGYFWDYYKWHTIGGAFAAVLIGVTFVQCATQTNYDLQVDFIAEYGLQSEEQEALVALAESAAEDITENGKTEAFVLALNMVETQDMQMTQAMQTKLMIEMGYSDGYTFIMSKKYADMLTEYEVLQPTSEWAGEYANDGVVISLADCRKLSEIGIETSGDRELYIGIAPLKENDIGDEEKIARYENGVRFAKSLIEQR